MHWRLEGGCPTRLWYIYVLYLGYYEEIDGYVTDGHETVTQAGGLDQSSIKRRSEKLVSRRVRFGCGLVHAMLQCLVLGHNVNKTYRIQK